MAGTSTAGTTQRGSNENVPNPVVGYRFAVVADAAAATIPDSVTGEIAGFLAGVGIEFGSTAPDSLAVVVKDIQGITIASGTLTASGRLTLDNPVPFAGALTVSASGNTTNSAEFEIMLLVI